MESLLAKPDGTLHVTPAGNHFITISKKQNLLLLSLVDITNPTSNFAQTALDLTAPHQLHLAYTQVMMRGLDWVPRPGNIALLGLGGGAMAHYLHHHHPQAILDCIEISPTITRLAQTYFGLQPSPTLRLHTQDAAHFLTTTPDSFDLIFMDVFEDKGFTPAHLITPEFHQLCRARLRPGGLAILNLASDNPQYPQRLATLQTTFPHILTQPVSPFSTIAFASNTPLTT